MLQQCSSVIYPPLSNYQFYYLLTLFLLLRIFSINASVTSSTEMTKSKTVIQMEKEKIYLFLHRFVKKV